MRLLLVPALLLATTAVAGDLVGSDGNDSVRLSTTVSCTNPAILAVIPAAEGKDWFAARALVAGVAYEACWRLQPGFAHLRYADGDQGLVPLGDLKPAPEA